MPTSDKLVPIQLRKRLQRARPKGSRWYGYLGKQDGTVEVSEKPGFYYVRIPKGASGTFQVGEFRGNAAPIMGMPVSIEEDPITGERYITGVDTIAYDAAGGEPGGAGWGEVPHHAVTHQLGGDDILELRPIQIVDCRTEPSGTAQHVTVREGWYNVGSTVLLLSAQVDVDLSGSWPASGAKWVWITVDSVGAVTVVDDGDTTWATMVYPTSGDFVSAIVVMRYGHPYIAIGDIVDMRFIHNSSKIPSPTLRGQMLRADASLLWEVFAKGTQYQVLTGGATDPTWGAVDLSQATAITNHLLLANAPTFALPRILDTSGVWSEYATVQDALDAVDNGETIFIPQGTWEEELTSPDKAFAMVGVGDRRQVILKNPNTATEVFTLPLGTTPVVYMQNITIQLSDPAGAGTGLNAEAGGTICHYVRFYIDDIGEQDKVAATSPSGSEFWNCEFYADDQPGAATATALDIGSGVSAYLYGGKQDGYFDYSFGGSGTAFLSGHAYDAPTNGSGVSSIQGDRLHIIDEYADTPMVAGDKIVFWDASETGTEPHKSRDFDVAISDVMASIRHPVTRITSGDSPYSADIDADEVIYCDTDGGDIEVDLPAGDDGKCFTIINCGSSGNDVMLDPNGSEQIYGSGAGTAITLYDSEVVDLHFESTEGWW